MRFLYTAGNTARALDKTAIPAGLKRQIMMGNYLSIFGALTTLSYQIFFALYDLAVYWPLVAFNTVFVVGYLLVPYLNKWNRSYAARNLVLGAVLAQVFIATYATSSGSGLHLFYLTLIAILPLMFHRYRLSRLIGMGCLIVALFVVCDLAFAPSMGVSPLPLPAFLMRIFYICSAMGSIALTGMFTYVFRVEIDRMETELKQTNRDLEKQSTTDSLTGLVNRRGLDIALDREWARMRRDLSPLSVLICDVDYFKAYNDYYGHPAGDSALRRIAEALKQIARRPGDLVARYGGEELVLILPRTGGRDARRVAETVRETVEGLGIEHEQSKISRVVTISIGISTAIPAPHLSPTHLFRAADDALYAAKEGGRNRVSLACVSDSPATLAGLPSR